MIETASTQAGLAPLIGPGARVLVLGSFPSRASLEAQQYYGHPRNAFWAIMAAVTCVGRAQPYDERVAALLARQVAVWDVLARCRRNGSLDSAIEQESEVPNPIPAMLLAHPSIRAILLNGRKAEQALLAHFPPVRDADVVLTLMPSTSPAYAGLNYVQKEAAWLAALHQTLDP